MKHNLARSRYCTDCRRPQQRAGVCADCKEFNRVLNLLHRGTTGGEPGKEHGGGCPS